MHGSQLFGQQPSFRGSDFGIPEIAYFGYAQFRNAVATSDDWDKHEGIELIFVRSGEACWEHGSNRLLRVSGGKGVLFPPGHPHRIVNGVYTPCQIVWVEFQGQDVAMRNNRLIPPEEIAALYDLANSRAVPVKLSEALMRTLASLCTLLANENLLIGSRVLMADVRSKFYASLVEFWKLCSLEGNGPAVNPIVRDAESLLQDDIASDEPINAIPERLGCRKSHLYQLFKQEIGMAPNDFRQRLRIRRSCDHLMRTDDQITDIAMLMGYSSSQYFARVFKKYVGFTPKGYRQLFRPAKA